MILGYFRSNVPFFCFFQKLMQLASIPELEELQTPWVQFGPASGEKELES